MQVPTTTSTFSPGTSVIPTSTIEISISCRNLLDKDILSKSDPMVVIYRQQPGGYNQWAELVRTETIQNNLNPEFSKKVTIDYRFEEQQPLKFEVYDIDSPSLSLQDHDFLGFAQTTVAAIVSSGSGGLTLPLQVSVTDGKKTHGSIILVAEEMQMLKDEATLKFGGTNLGSMFCCVFPQKVFYTISKVNEASKYVLVYRSEPVAGPDPTWRQTVLTVRSLCNGDRERGLKIECFEDRWNGSHQFLGSCVTNLNQLMELNGNGVKLQGPDGRECSSLFLILMCNVQKLYTFVDYLQHGTKIHCCFAVDFTSSNGDASDPSSLHHFSTPGCPNPYEQAIQAVGDVIRDYDDNKMFPVLGFGARIPPHGNVSHNFNINLNDSPYCHDIGGVLDAYRNCVRQIQMYGPTNFSPIINHVARMASTSRHGSDYYVLLIITDGIITDMVNTKETIVNNAILPMSIIIVGVGGADFSAMEELDGDSIRLSSNGRFAERDIVQFVPYRDAYTWMTSTAGPGVTQYVPPPTYNPNPAPYGAIAGHGQGDWNQQAQSMNRLAQIKLAQEVLQEIPDQLASYMKSKLISPSSVSVMRTAVAGGTLYEQLRDDLRNN